LGIWSNSIISDFDRASDLSASESSTRKLHFLNHRAHRSAFPQLTCQARLNHRKEKHFGGKHHNEATLVANVARISKLPIWVKYCNFEDYYSGLCPQNS
jgi:hypothetical protein